MKTTLCFSLPQKATHTHNTTTTTTTHEFTIVSEHNFFSQQGVHTLYDISSLFALQHFNVSIENITSNMEFSSSKFFEARTSIETCFQRVIENSYLEEDLSCSESIMHKLIESESLLKKIYSKSQKRSLMDKKVAPGSDSVVCSVLNARYCLCLININMGKHYELQSDTYELSISCYQRALIWHPKSIEAGHLLGLCLRSRAVSSDKLDFVQFVWERAMAATHALEEQFPNTQIEELTQLSSSEQTVLDILLSSDPDLSSHSVEPSVMVTCVNKAQTSIIYHEREVGKKLMDSLILFYCQENLLVKAFPLLLCKRYQLKLSQQVLTYSSAAISSGHDLRLDARQKELETRADFPFTFGYDAVLPENYLLRLQHVFRPSSPYWREHQYDFYSNCSRQVGYFSYLYPFRDRAAGNVIEQVIDIVYRRLIAQLQSAAAVTDDGDNSGSGSDSSSGGSGSSSGSGSSGGRQQACLTALRDESTVAEWWVHSRPHTSGHQFHFDSDETATCDGEQARVSRHTPLE
jgi:uncharacterized membrane protein YgcG